MSNFDLVQNKVGRVCDYNHYGDHSEIRPYETYAQGKEYMNFHFKKLPQFMIERILCRNLGMDKPEKLDLEEQMSGLTFDEKVEYIRRSKMEENQDREFGYKKLEQPKFYYSNIEEVD